MQDHRFDRSFVATLYLLGTRGEALAPWEDRAADLVRALGDEAQPARAGALAAALMPVREALERLDLK